MHDSVQFIQGAGIFKVNIPKIHSPYSSNILCFCKLLLKVVTKITVLCVTKRTILCWHSVQL